MSTQHGRTLAWIAGVIGILSTVLGVLGLTHTAGDQDPPGVHGRPVDPTAVVPASVAPPPRVGRPTRLSIPAIGVDEPLEARGLTDAGEFDTPDFGDAAWYAPGPRPGEAGGAVVVAHVHGPDGPDVFWDLATLEPGDLVRIRTTTGPLTFVVDALEDVAKDELPDNRIWPETDAALLRLITCGGQRLPQGGYPDNTIVYAHLVR